MTEQKPVEIQAEITPNPNTLKFVVDRKLLESGSRNFTSKEAAKGSLLPESIFSVENVTGVMVAPDFITVTKNADADWKEVVNPVVAKMRDFFASGKDPVSKEETQQSSSNSEIEKKIMAILDAEIRPAVARDGGDIIFYGFEDGVVKLQLQGACSSCPSSTMTLKMGIESRLKQALPEVKEVQQV